MHLDLDGVLSGLVDAQLLLCFMGILRNLQLIQQVHTSAIIEQRIDPCAVYRGIRPTTLIIGLKAACLLGILCVMQRSTLLLPLATIIVKQVPAQAMHCESPSLLHTQLLFACTYI